MSNLLSSGLLPPLLAAIVPPLVLAVPLAWLLTVVVAARARSDAEMPWRLAHAVAIFGGCVALMSGLLMWLRGAATYTFFGSWVPGLRLDPLAALVLVMVGFLGWVIVRYSRGYLNGDVGRSRYLAWLCATLAAVWCLLAFNNLLLVCIAWSLSSLCLHPLLTFYRSRPAAMLAAHKKFLVSRVADLLTLSGCVFMYAGLGTLQIDKIAQLLAAPAAIAPATVGGWVAAGGVMFALAAILKCAQLPFHGWLLQVMEAPTPVSALLHAGIVNIGGFVLLRLTGVLEFSLLAQVLLVVAGSITAALAALVMMTRISVKVMLAWSTVAQMGFMLLEIGLGAYSLALLHLLAHSMYKAYSFLAAGDTVRHQHTLRLAPAVRPITATQGGLAALGLPLGVGAAAWLCGVDLVHEPATWVLAGALLCGLWPLIRARSAAGVTGQFAVLAGSAFGLSLLYFAWHRLFDHLAPVQNTAPSAYLLGFAGACLLALLVVQEAVLALPDGKLSRWLHPRAFAGFHLDEAFTRLTWTVWPAPRVAPGSGDSSFAPSQTAPNTLSQEVS
jgi:NAD(P)H-quinone oxidoreductase subunit 5